MSFDLTDWRDLAVKLISPFEGCAKRGKDGLVYPYLDKLAKPNLWTRGYGRTYGINKDSSSITKEEALVELRDGVSNYGLRCVKLAPVLATRPQCLAAVTSWAWNCGLGAFKVSRLRKAINQGRWNDAVELIKKPRTAGGIEYRGLARRRDAESVLFRNGF